MAVCQKSGWNIRILYIAKVCSFWGLKMPILSFKISFYLMFSYQKSWLHQNTSAWTKITAKYGSHEPVCALQVRDLYFSLNFWELLKNVRQISLNLLFFLEKCLDDSLQAFSSEFGAINSQNFNIYPCHWSRNSNSKRLERSWQIFE